MAAPKRQALKKAKPTRASAQRGKSDTSLYLGSFDFVEPGEPQRMGTFQILVEASDPERAVSRFRTRLRELRTTTSLFDSPTTIYAWGFIELGGSFKNGLLINYESRPAPEFDQVLHCLIPEQKHDCQEYGIGSGEDGDSEPFIDFGGVEFGKALARAKRKPGLESASASPTLEPRQSRRSPQENAQAREEARQQKEQRAAEKQARRQSRAAAQERKKKRTLAISETLEELGASSRKRKQG